MPSKSREKDHERDRSSTVKSRDKDSKKDKDKDKEKIRHSRSSHGKSSELSTKEQSRGGTVGRSATSSTTTSTSSRRRRRSSMADVDSAGRGGAASFLESRTSLPYPSFSKAHSKEAVGSRDNVDRGLSILTPDPTDVDSTKEKSGSSGKGAPNGTTSRSDNHNAPPSPPLTSVDQRSQRKDSTAGNRSSDEKAGEKVKTEKTKVKIKSQSSSSLSARKDDKSKSSKPHGEVDSPHRAASHRASSTRMHDEVKLPRRSATTSSPRSSPRPAEAASQATNESDATSVAPNQPPAYQRPATSHTRPPSRSQARSSMSHRSDLRKQTPIEVFVEPNISPTSARYGAPPPPPPPPEMPISIPRVDYLLQNGGLNYKVPKNLLAAGEPLGMTQQSFQPQVAVGKVFEPYNRLLDDYTHIMTKNGSIAVATGYRSVARRLLDRLEAVFARDISSESCECLMCGNRAPDEHVSGVSWGEVLELVSGRRELPNWPPFTIAPSLGDRDVSGEEHIPMQKLDIDVPEEYRDHYIRQSRKTKLAVDKWLTEQSASAPDEVDDETLTFAIMTHLDPEKRALFRALLGHSTSIPTSPAQPRARPAVLISSGLAIQRLYRLSSVPRDPETAIYMLENINMHNVLATLAAISDDEWDILISGRFDGFLRSGAEDAFIPSMSGSVPPRPLSQSTNRSATPFNGSSRGSYMDGSYRPASQPYGTNGVPASFGAPIAMDEETEIAALAEVERDIYLSMEALEDAFEVLHCKAEAVRRALRERGAGLAVASQARRGSYVEARLGTPASALHSWEDGPEDDGIDDDMSLAPDDSASNISSNRRRRPKRRTERRTPAPVEEEDEEEDAHISRRDTKSSRKR
ncbi:hypothetical protein DTO217A2_6751 [Paecilomyces variotii]|nr:hypothetical protein DTO217A2_6751 [Paecilomyces variotii]